MEKEKSVKLLKEAYVVKALMADQGEDTEIISWTMEHFENIADNYASVIKYIKLKYRKGDKIHLTSYVIKLSPCKKNDLDKENTNIEFMTETGFYVDILPNLTRILKSKGMEPLRVPKYLFSITEKGSELIIMEDLRERGFKLYDRTKSLDVNHTYLVLQELARLHAASHLLLEETPGTKFLDIYPWWVLTENDNAKTMFHNFLFIYVKVTQKILKDMEMYEKAQNWLGRNKEEYTKRWDKHMSDEGLFSVICQGDCWTSNLLFRYDARNQPVEVMILDFQNIRISTLSSELQEFVYMSLDGTIRKDNLKSFLNIYHETYSKVIETPNGKMLFTLEDLRQEYKRTLVIGFLVGVIAVPWMVGPDLALQWYEGPAEDDEQFEIFLENMKLNAIKAFNSDSYLRDRYFSIFDDMLEGNVIT